MFLLWQMLHATKALWIHNLKFAFTQLKLFISFVFAMYRLKWAFESTSIIACSFLSASLHQSFLSIFDFSHLFPSPFGLTLILSRSPSTNFYSSHLFLCLLFLSYIFGITSFEWLISWFYFIYLGFCRLCDAHLVYPN